MTIPQANRIRAILDPITDPIDQMAWDRATSRCEVEPDVNYRELRQDSREIRNDILAWIATPSKPSGPEKTQ